MKQKNYRKEVYTVEIVRDTRNGVALVENWIRDNKAHREGGPAQIERDAATGVVTREAWMRNNEYDRENGPAVILRKAATGHVYSSAWFTNGKKIRPPRPQRKPVRVARAEPSSGLGPGG